MMMVTIIMFDGDHCQWSDDDGDYFWWLSLAMTMMLFDDNDDV